MTLSFVILAFRPFRPGCLTVWNVVQISLAGVGRVSAGAVDVIAYVATPLQCSMLLADSAFVLVGSVKKGASLLSEFESDVWWKFAYSWMVRRSILP